MLRHFHCVDTEYLSLELFRIREDAGKMRTRITPNIQTHFTQRMLRHFDSQTVIHGVHPFHGRIKHPCHYYLLLKSTLIAKID